MHSVLTMPKDTMMTRRGMSYVSSSSHMMTRRGINLYLHLHIWWPVWVYVRYLHRSWNLLIEVVLPSSTTAKGGDSKTILDACNIGETHARTYSRIILGSCCNLWRVRSAAFGRQTKSAQVKSCFETFQNSNWNNIFSECDRYYVTYRQTYFQITAR